MGTTTAATETGLRLVEEFTFRPEFAPSLAVGTGPLGTRMIFALTGGRAEGERFNADLLPGGSDWALFGPDGFARSDIRSQFRTDDGALVYVHTAGLVELNEAVRAATEAKGETQFGDHYWRATLRFETGDARYAWMNTRLFVAAGRLASGTVDYRVYRVD